MSSRALFGLWCLLLVATLIGVTICIRWLDEPVALLFFSNANRVSGLGKGLGSAVLVSGQMAILVTLAIVRMSKGNLPAFTKAVFVACCASLSAFGINEYVLKFVFGRHNPSLLFHGFPNHVFNFFQGDQNSSFPSGHMVMATAFGVALIRLEPRVLPAVAILLCIGGAALIVGDWHFVGDVIAGVFVGGTAGFVAGELWLEHLQRHGLTWNT